MDVPQISRLNNVAIAVTKFGVVGGSDEDKLRRQPKAFSEFCHAEDYLGPLQERFILLPGVIAAYVNPLATSNKSQ
ncbi:LOW QUALITY PROTEIN: hypothetical protein PHMEG_00040285 [Phytophthora megakarya]|uniref:Uncharacterized protein n=1 Tax=Phytophthora megakarya TaxID=4795 RepID=A0A225UDB9_9STRA|nr:LOW QUALITY PROTEIN: hypothetical protein PHMEG_00040285 [Phytophthora megakarya]